MIFEEEVLGEGTGSCSLDPNEFSGLTTFLKDILVSQAFMMQQSLHREARLAWSRGMNRRQEC